LLRSGLVTNTLQWSEIGYTVSRVAGRLSNVSFGPSAGWSIEWSDAGNIAQPGPGLFFITSGVYVAWSTYTNGGFTTHYTTNTFVPSATKLLPGGGGLNVGATQYVDLTINDSTGVPQQGYHITYQHAINGVIGAGMQSLFVITRVY
jgi:hypothetical protein